MNAPAASNPPEYGAPLTLADAKKIMEGAEKEAKAQNWPMVIAILDSGGHLIMLHKMDQAQLGSVEVAQAKARTSVNFRRPTKVFEDIIAGGGMGLRTLTMPGMIALEGGLPIMKDGKVIGGIGVSGMQSSQDAQVARAGLAAIA